MALSLNLGVVEINTLWHFRLLLLAQMLIKAASSLSLLGIGSLISHKIQEILFRVESCNISLAGYFVNKHNIKAIQIYILDNKNHRF